ncbi:glycosyltransferase family 2 protein [Dactylosporangium sp. CA-092794]|uniref:glycosyltransferase family 2 protein n=1 Tax=Dactylosporangium sp. CA-092794 TaxID=3239929 RepID=UPI003D8B5679
MSAPVTVVVGAHSMRRWPYLCRAVQSARTQQPAPAEIVVVVDHNEELLGRVVAEIPAVTVLRNRYHRGASGTRNTGAEHARTDLIAFLDDDAAARPGWLAALVEPFSDESVVGTGGDVQPLWEVGRPRWFPAEFHWVVGASYAGMPVVRTRVRNVWSENMAVRRSVFAAVGGFRIGFGKLGDRSRPEDTDLCIRMAAARLGAVWLHVPDAVADHRVPADRSTFRFFLRRCYHEGWGKIELARLLNRPGSLASESAYLRRLLPAAVVHGLADTIRGRPWGAARSAAIVAGVLATALGVVRAQVSLARPGRRPVVVADGGVA